MKQAEKEKKEVKNVLKTLEAIMRFQAGFAFGMALCMVNGIFKILPGPRVSTKSTAAQEAEADRFLT